MNKVRDIASICLLGLLNLMMLYYFFTGNLSINVYLEIIKTSATVSATIIAFVFFDGYGIKKKVAEKKYENVVNVLDEIYKLTLVADYKNNETQRGSYIPIILRKNMNLQKIKNDFLSEYYQANLLVKLDGFLESIEKLNELALSIWTPKEVSKSLDFLIFQKAQIKQQAELLSEYKEYVIIGKRGKSDEEKIANFNDGNITFGEFLKNLYSIVWACDTWLTNNAFEPDVLNL